MRTAHALAVAVPIDRRIPVDGIATSKDTLPASRVLGKAPLDWTLKQDTDVMRQAFWIFTLASAVVAAAPRGSVQAGSGPKDAIAQAREQIASKHPKAAAGVLEDALGDSRGEDRDAILDLLKETYKSLIREAQAAGETEDAELYADDLAILEAQPGFAAPPVAEATRSPRFEPPPDLAPAKAPTVPDVQPAPAPNPESKTAASVPLPRSDKAVGRVGFVEPDPPVSPTGLPPLEAPEARDAAIPNSPTLAAPGKIAPAPAKTDAASPIRHRRTDPADDGRAGGDPR